jgi:hypothetical protein
VEEARRRGKQQVLVGTANSSISNIAFYQKCGFRMDHIRPDYFWYYDPPRYEHGLQIRDMLVFRYDLGPRPPTRSRRGRERASASKSRSGTTFLRHTGRASTHAPHDDLQHL